MAGIVGGKHKILGEQGLVVESAGELAQARTGLWTGSVRFKFPPGKLELLKTGIKNHPFIKFMEAENARVSFTPGLWTAYVDYAGAEYDSTEEQTVYELSVGTQAEDIETHPDFVTKLAGTPQDPKNGAKFVGGKFVEFPKLLSDGTENKYGGLKSYISPSQTTWKKSWVQKAKPKEGKVKERKIPPGDPPTYGGKSTWLELPLSYVKRGNVYSCSQVWMASGPKGIVPLVYEE